jgi:activator of HSP90 ATPase
MKTKSIKQTVTFKTTPEKFYNLMMDENKHAVFTGAKASISKLPDGRFTVFGGYCHGYNIELIVGKKIVQAWHFAEDGWPDDHFSICNFELEQIGDKTKLTFIQTNVPEHKVATLRDGWKEFYWDPIKSYLKSN